MPKHYIIYLYYIIIIIYLYILLHYITLHYITLHYHGILQLALYVYLYLRRVFYSFFAHSLAGPGCPVDLAALSQELPKSCKVRLTVCKTQVVGALRWCQWVDGEVASASMCTVTVFYMWVKCVH